MRNNPFRPNSPVNPGMFVGRLDEIETLERSLLQTRAESPCHFMITGERGIGKTSLLLYLRYIATGQITLNGEKLNFLVVDLDTDNKTTQRGLVERITLQLDRVLGQSEPARQFLKQAWSFLQRVKVMDSGIDRHARDQQSDEVLLDEFAASLADVGDRVCRGDGEGNLFQARHDGLLILIDEADNSSPELGLGSFLKLLLERLQKRGCNRVLVGLAGLPELRNRLYVSHQSSVRVFQELPLGRLTSGEVAQVIGICLERANTDNVEKTTMAEDAKNSLVALSEGFPHFIQQFGFSAFGKDTDGTISKQDVELSAFGPGGALETIGDRYYRHDFYNKIQQESYRQVLRIMADDLDGWVTRAKIAAKFKGKPGILNNAIKALRDRHIIWSKEGEKGVYRLQHKGFALWIKLYADPDFLRNMMERIAQPQPGTANGTGPTTPPTVQ